jgi:hypothetical protein
MVSGLPLASSHSSFDGDANFSQLAAGIKKFG